MMLIKDRMPMIEIDNNNFFLNSLLFFCLTLFNKMLILVVFITSFLIVKFRLSLISLSNFLNSVFS